ncbi:MAG: hypothetical protein AAGK14_09145 [Verrucomicrobiota bacterium]
MTFLLAVTLGFTVSSLLAVLLLNTALRHQMSALEWQMIYRITRRKIFYTAICFGVVFGVGLTVLVTSMRFSHQQAFAPNLMLMTQLGLMIMLLAAAVHFYEVAVELRATKVRQQYRRAWLALQIAPFVIVGFMLTVVNFWLHA